MPNNLLHFAIDTEDRSGRLILFLGHAGNLAGAIEFHIAAVYQSPMGMRCAV